MLIIPESQSRQRRIKVALPKQSPVLPLTLVSAAYESGGSELVLTFDRAIDLAAIDVSAFVIEDGAMGMLYQGHLAAVLAGPASVLIAMNGIEAFSGPGVTLDAAANNGILASGDGAAWAGVADLALPFG